MSNFSNGVALGYNSEGYTSGVGIDINTTYNQLTEDLTLSNSVVVIPDKTRAYKWELPIDHTEYPLFPKTRTVKETEDSGLVHFSLFTHISKDSKEIKIEEKVDVLPEEDQVKILDITWQRFIHKIYKML